MKYHRLFACYQKPAPWASRRWLCNNKTWDETSSDWFITFSSDSLQQQILNSDNPAGKLTYCEIELDRPNHGMFLVDIVREVDTLEELSKAPDSEITLERTFRGLTNYQSSLQNLLIGKTEADQGQVFMSLLNLQCSMRELNSKIEYWKERHGFASSEANLSSEVS